MVNWKSNVFPGILGRTCDRPCEPACRRGRVEENQGEKPEPVAICRLKRVAADFKDDIRERLPKKAAKRNGKRIACVGAGPASLTVARDLAPLGYHVTLFDSDRLAGGMIRSQIPKFRLPETVIDEEVGYILDLGVEFRAGHRIDSLKALLGEGYDAVFIGSGAPRGRDLDIPGPQGSGRQHPHRHRLALVGLVRPRHEDRPARDRAGRRQHRDGLLPLLAPAGRRGREGDRALGLRGDEGEPLGEGRRDARGHPDPQLPRAQGVPARRGQLTGVLFEKVKAVRDEKGRRSLVPTGEPDQTFECDDVLVAVGQENAFPWIERDIGIEFDQSGMPVLDPVTLQSTQPKVFFGGDAAFGPKNIIWAVAHGHDAAISIDRLCHGEDVKVRPPPMVNLLSQKMGIHEWSYDNQVAPDERFKVPLKDLTIALKDIRQEVELGFDPELAWKEAQRCLNCDVQTVFAPKLCIECDACVDICPMDCITFTANGEEGELRARLNAPSAHPAQALYVSTALKTERVMVKDEDVCLHCGLCAERCPTGAWDMQKFLLEMTHAGPRCSPSGARKAPAWNRLPL